MTPEERAEKVFDALEAAEGEQLCGARVRPERVSLIAAAIRDAVLAEREACARLADSMDDRDCYGVTPGSVAAAIRARGQT